LLLGLFSAVLASFLLKEKLGRIGKIGWALCLLGSIIIVLHAPEDKEVKTVDEILGYAMHPGKPISLKKKINSLVSGSG
jgi:drug/metabolite transporter (DMT)-like permease